MAKDLPEGVKSEIVVWHKPDGTPTTNKEEAVTAEVTTTYTDGRVEHSILRRKDAKAPRGAGAAL